MKIEKHGKKYRVQKMYKGVKYNLLFDHKPTQKEIALEFAAKLEEGESVASGTFKYYANQYIENRRNVVSPSTIRTYQTKLKQLSHEFKYTDIIEIKSADVQAEVNYLAGNYEPKTVKTAHGFISSVLREYRPNLNLRTKLPQAIKKDVYEPNNDDIKRIIERAKGTHFHVAFQLGVLSCRRGEICAASIEDLDGNNLKIHRNMVYDENNQWVIKESPKTDASNRTIPLPQELADEIREQGFIFDGHPNALNKAIHRFQKELGIPPFKFHTLRSYFASYADSVGIPESAILALGGWNTPSIMKSVYRKALEKSKQESVKKLSDGLFG